MVVSPDVLRLGVSGARRARFRSLLRPSALQSANFGTIKALASHGQTSRTHGHDDITLEVRNHRTRARDNTHHDSTHHVNAK
jgi:hypothetical protein